MSNIQPSTKPALEKMHLKSQQKAYFVNIPADLKHEFEILSEGSTITTIIEEADFILLFATQEQTLLDDISNIFEKLKPTVNLWIAYPKGQTLQTDLKRDSLQQALRRFDLQGVSIIAINPLWAAMQFKKISPLAA